MRRELLLPLTLVGLVGCQSPIVRMAAPGEHPLRVNVWIHQDLPGREGAEARFSEALRDQLANRARVLPQGAGTSPEEAQLEVHITAAQERGDLVKENAKAAFLKPVAALTAGGLSTYNPYGFVFFTALGLVSGTVASPVAAVGTEARGLYHNARLGYKPRHLVCKVSYRPSGAAAAEVLFPLGAWEVVKAMRPLAEGEPERFEAVRKEEAAALARVVVTKLTEELHWAVLPRSIEPDPQAAEAPH